MKPKVKAADTLDSLFEDIISEGMSQTYARLDKSILSFAKQKLFNGQDLLYPTQKVILKLYNRESLNQEELEIANSWVAADRCTYKEERSYQHVVIEGGRRMSKSMLLAVICLYELDNLISLDNPALHYNLLPGSPIALFVISQSLEQVTRTLFAQIRGFAEQSLYFKGLEKQGKLEFLQKEIRSKEKNVGLYAGHTNSKALVGYSIKLLVLDEVARFEIDEYGNSKADEVWDNIGAACLHRDSYLLTNKGYIQAGQLYDSKQPFSILTYNPHTFHQYETNRVKLFDNGIQATRRVTTKSSRQEIYTHKHPLFVWSGTSCQPQWIEAKDLQVGDLIACSRDLPLFSNTNVVNSEVSRLIGYLQGDGGLTTGSIRITNLSDKLIKDIQTILDANFPGMSINRIGTSINFILKKPKGVHSNPLIQYLKNLDLPFCKAPQKRIPSFISQSSKNVIAQFLNGLWCTDGYITRTHIGITLSSKEFIEDIQRELIRFGIYSKIRSRKRSARDISGKGTYSPEAIHWELSIRDRESATIFSRDIGCLIKQPALDIFLNTFTSLARTTCQFNQLPIGANYRLKLSQKKLNIPFHKLNIDYHYKRNKPIRSKVIHAAKVLNDIQLEGMATNLYWEPIKSIEDLDASPTIGITVEDTHLIAGPIFSHNTNTFGKEGRKIAISSAWEPNDKIQQLWNLCKRDTSMLGFRFRTWDVNLNPSFSEAVLKQSSEYIKDPIKAALEFEGIRIERQGSFFTEESVKAVITGESVIDCQPIPIDRAGASTTRYYAGTKITRLEKDSSDFSFAHVDYGITKDQAAFAFCKPHYFANEGAWGIKVDGIITWKPYVDSKAIKRIVDFVGAEKTIEEICIARNVKLLSFDQFNSESSIQRLHQKGIETKCMSTTTSNQASYYTLFRRLIEQQTIILPREGYTSIQMEQDLAVIIQLPNGKITHKVGYKDIPDALVNCVYNCYHYMTVSGKTTNTTTSLIKVESANSHTLSSNRILNTGSRRQAVLRFKNNIR